MEAIVPPVGHGVANGSVVEPDHVGDLPPAMLTHPRTSVKLAYDILDTAIRIGGRSLVVRVKLEAAHHSHVTVVPGQHVGDGHLVETPTLVGDTVQGRRSLRVVVVNESERIKAVQKAPTLSEVDEVGQSLTVTLPQHVGQLSTVLELLHPADVRVVRALNWLASIVNDLDIHNEYSKVDELCF